MFSIICPVYNSEFTLRRCVDSVLAQRFKDWELILIDDGSIDNSWNIIKNYEKQDSRVIGLRQENKGPGIARNVGIRKASGEYLVFLDSDDFISPDYLSLVSQKTPKSDVIFIDIDQIDEKLETLRHEKMSEFSRLSKDEIIRANLTGKMMWGGVRKVVRRSLIVNGSVKYSGLDVGEENLYTYLVLSLAEDISFVDEKPIYFYVNRPGSQSKSILDDPYGPVYDAVRLQIEQDETYEKYAATLNTLNAVAAVVSFDRITKNHSGIQLLEASKVAIAKFRQKHDSRFGFDYKSMDSRVKVLIPLLNISARRSLVLVCRIKQLIQRKMQ